MADDGGTGLRRGGTDAMVDAADKKAAKTVDQWIREILSNGVPERILNLARVLQAALIARDAGGK